jgi:hypothetical protein
VKAPALPAHRQRHGLEASLSGREGVRSALACAKALASPRHRCVAGRSKMGRGSDVAIDVSTARLMSLRLHLRGSVSDRQIAPRRSPRASMTGKT